MSLYREQLPDPHLAGELEHLVLDMHLTTNGHLSMKVYRHDFWTARVVSQETVQVRDPDYWSSAIYHIVLPWLSGQAAMVRSPASDDTQRSEPV